MSGSMLAAVVRESLYLVSGTAMVLMTRWLVIRSSFRSDIEWLHTHAHRLYRTCQSRLLRGWQTVRVELLSRSGYTQARWLVLRSQWRTRAATE